MSCAVDWYGPPRCCLPFALNCCKLTQLCELCVFLCWFCGSVHVVTACWQVVSESRQLGRAEKLTLGCSDTVRKTKLCVWVCEYVSVIVCVCVVEQLSGLHCQCCASLVIALHRGVKRGCWVLLLGSWWRRVMEERLVFELWRAVSLEDLTHHKVLSFISHHITKVLNSYMCENSTRSSMCHRNECNKRCLQ